jgi:hypothetical protein
MRFWGVIVMLWLMLMPGVAPSARSSSADMQSSREACPAYVNNALRQLENNCNRLDRNSACYGYDSVYVTFSQPMPDEFFTRPADRAELKLLHTIQTTPLDLDMDEWGLALLNVQANVPHTLPGQAVVFLLLGGIEIENRVSAEQLPEMGEPIPVEAAHDSNLRANPHHNARIAGSVATGTTLLADAVSQDEEWVRVLRDDVSPLWIYRELLQPEVELEQLPRVNPTHMSPMQAFRFHTGIGAPMCEEATETLIIQGPDDIQVDIEANGAVISIASTIALNITESGNLRVTTLSGTAYVENRVVPAGYTIEITLDENGDVNGSWSVVRPLEPQELNGQYAGLSVPAEVLHYPIPQPLVVAPPQDEVAQDSLPKCLPPECAPPGLGDDGPPGLIDNDALPDCLPPECTPPGLVDKDVPGDPPDCVPPECEPPGLVDNDGLPDCLPPECEPPGLVDNDGPPECLPPECAPPGLGDDGPPGLGDDGPPGQSVRP